MSRLKQLVTRLRRPDMREVAVAQVSDKYSEYQIGRASCRERV